MKRLITELFASHFCLNIDYKDVLELIILDLDLDYIYTRI